mmetsp:Transcript_26166/g.40254  ORF Transcript_26166/g.40254 Transcript_26166/m.40254 type:complete len:580 (+) Transcript_26166:76-1815(+)
MIAYQAVRHSFTIPSSARFFTRRGNHHAIDACGTFREKSSLSMNQQYANSRATPTKQGSSNKNPVPDFHDSKAAYETKGTIELLRASICFNLCKIPIVVNNSEGLLRLSRKVLGGTITDGVLKASLYGHFCAGEDQKRIQPVLKRLDSAGVGSILDYAAESDGEPSPARVDKGKLAPHALRKVREYDYESEAQCDRHVETFKACINDVASLGGKDGYAAIKVTALGNPKLLARMSQAITEAKRLFEKFDDNMDGSVSREEFETAYNLFFNDGDASLKDIFEEFDPNGTGNVDYISWSMCLTPKDLPLITKQCRDIGPLALATPTEEEVELIEAMYERGRELGTEAAKVGTRLLIDAEQVRFQPAIDNLVLDLQQTFNAKGESDKPIIYNTYQCYLKDAMERLTTDVQRADRFDYHFGAKLVRGAYMESERALAMANGLVSPIHETIQDTHACYNDAVEFLVEHSTKTDNQIELMVASHNQESIERAIDVMNKYGIDRQSSIVCFAQLYGMTDNLSFNLGRHGYRAYKYVPYGEVHEVMPYLLRRARENSAIVGGAAAEATMIGNELKRRFLSPMKSLRA